MLERMSRARATALVLFAALAAASGCGESEAPVLPSGDAGTGSFTMGGEAGVSEVPAGSGGSGARGESGAENGGEGGVASAARPSSGGSSGRKPNTLPGAGGKGGGTATSGGSGGDESSGAAAGEAGASSGGSSGTGTSGGASSAQGGSSTVAGATGTAGAGGQSNQLSICVRPSSTTSLSGTVTNDFQNDYARDCNVNWLFYLYYDPAHDIDHLQDFMNQVFHFNLGLWGCTDGAPPTSFDLVYGTPSLTAADAGALIDAYMSASEADLSLSPSERDAMRAVLERLSEPLLVPADPGVFSHSRCGAAGAGGQGGLGGQPGTGGLGGTDSNAAGQGGAGQGDTGGGG